MSNLRGRRRGVIMVAFGLLALALVAGCGGGGGSSSSSSATTTKTVAGVGEPSPETKPTPAKANHHHPAEAHKAKKKKAKTQQQRRRSGGESKKKKRSPAATPTHHRSKKTHPAPAEAPVEEAGSSGNSLGGATAIEIRKLRKHCPKGVESKSCTTLVEAYVSAQGAESKPLNSPEECLASRSKAECEAIFRAQSEAAGGESVVVQECLANMTPKCEEILRPYFESRQASEAAGG